MASEKTIAIVKSTAPILKELGTEITTVFYRRLFENHPELRDIFNMTHQKQGTQPKVLANAIFMYAQYIDQLDMLSGAVESIAQKHTSLAITPEMYDIVGSNLLAAIKEVLKEGATDEIIAAWAEAYGDLALIFINREEQIYVQRELSSGGFRGKKKFKVVDKVKESNLITSFYLKPTSGDEVPLFDPGQYIALTAAIEGEEHSHTRNYSLSDAPLNEYLRISVKKEPGKPAGIVSNYLHEKVSKGDELQLGVPSGEFVLKPSENPVLLISGGVGITPLMSMFSVLAEEEKREVVFVQCAKNGSVHAFKEGIGSKTNSRVQSVVIYDDPLESEQLGVDYDYKGYVTKEVLMPYIKEQTEVYFCGPTPFMRNVLQVLNELKVQEENINYEFFGPSEELAV